MGVIPAPLWRNTNFRIGLAIRVAMALLVVPQVQQMWFVPFMRHAIVAPSLDPWSSYFLSGGSPMAFPYGAVMFLCHLPFVAVGMLLEWASGLPGLAQIGFAISLVTADALLLSALYRLAPHRLTGLVRFYWLSPLVIYVTLWHGQTDVIPMALLIVSLLLLRQWRSTAAGIVYALALAAKLSIAIPLPFILLFLWQNRRYRWALQRFAIAVALGSVALQLPMLLSSGYHAMVLGSPEISRIYDIAIPLGSSASIYVVPTLYLLLLFWAWQIGRMNFEMLLTFLGVSYFLILLATPAAVGWFLWIFPFLALFEAASGRAPRLLVAAFSAVFVIVKLMTVSGAALPFFGLDLQPPLGGVINTHLSPQSLSIAMSVLTATGLAICATMVQRALHGNDFYRLSRRPLIVGIAGDSSSGKDTLSAGLAGLFGDHSVASVSGDDYHRFERNSPMWKTLTHLDPRANDLASFSNDCFALVEGRSVLCRHYDHTTGLFTRRQQRQANDVVLVSGLHALYPEDLRTRMDLRVFLDMDEDLRRFLKQRRDVSIRGHAPETVTALIDRRRADFDRFVRPQIERADLVFSLRAAAPLPGLDYQGPLPLCLRIVLRSGLRADELIRVLISLCGIHAALVPGESGQTTEVLIDDDSIGAEDARDAATLLVPHIEDLLDIAPQWQGGMTGIMQLVVLMAIAERTRNRT